MITPIRKIYNNLGIKPEESEYKNNDIIHFYFDSDKISYEKFASTVADVSEECPDGLISWLNGKDDIGRFIVSVQLFDEFKNVELDSEGSRYDADTSSSLTAANRSTYTNNPD